MLGANQVGFCTSTHRRYHTGLCKNTQSHAGAGKQAPQAVQTHWSLAGHNGLDEEAEHGEHGQTAILQLLDLQAEATNAPSQGCTLASWGQQASDASLQSCSWT